MMVAMGHPASRGDLASRGDAAAGLQGQQRREPTPQREPAEGWRGGKAGRSTPRTDMKDEAHRRQQRCAMLCTYDICHAVEITALLELCRSHSRTEPQDSQHAAALHLTAGYEQRGVFYAEATPGSWTAPGGRTDERTGRASCMMRGG